MQITFIRHLPTDWNVQQKLQGRRDIEISQITEEFQKKITANQRVLQELAPFDLVLASTLRRTHQTADAYGYCAETEELLDELDFGLFEGRSKRDLYEAYGDLWILDPQKIVLGEEISKLEERIVQFLEKYIESKNILVFGHGLWIRAIMSYHHYNHINNMNQLGFENNQCITLKF